MTVKEKIIEQSVEMFINSGVKAVTMDDISREAGVSKRTIYENFKDKDELLQSCLGFMDAKYNQDYDQIVSESANTINMVFSLMKLGIKAIKTINPLFFTDLKRYHYPIWKHSLVVNHKKQEAQILTILRKGINQGLFRKNIDVNIVSKLLIEQLRVISDESIFPEEFSKIVVFENVLINFFRGIATHKGMELIDKYLGDESDHFMTV